MPTQSNPVSPVENDGLHQPQVLTLCTGNAARSVMAGAMLRSAPVHIVTAGTHVVEGQPMSRRTREALASVEMVADGHRSHQLTDGDVDNADLIIAMAGEHVNFIRRRYPGAAARTGSIKRLCRDLSDGPEPLTERVAHLGLAEVMIDGWEDVDDPAGGDDEMYLACARELAGLCLALLPRLR
jgi:protein-tyrosine phosphatase